MVSLVRASCCGAQSVVDDVHGGFNNQLLDDGSVYDADTKHVVGTCRFTVNYALATLLDLPT